MGRRAASILAPLSRKALWHKQTSMKPLHQTLTFRKNRIMVGGVNRQRVPARAALRQPEAAGVDGSGKSRTYRDGTDG